MVETIDRELIQFRGGLEQSDDITLLEVTFIPGFTARLEPDAVPHKSAFHWAAEFEVEGSSLAVLDPLPHLVQLVAEVQGLGALRQQLQTLFAELYSNALDHGVLKLDSRMKQSAEGFGRYYIEREARIRELSEGSIRMRLRHAPLPEGGGRLTIEVEDSGDGFDFQTATGVADRGERVQASALHGRGLSLIRSLCSDVTFLGNGNRVRVSFDWS